MGNAAKIVIGLCVVVAGMQLFQPARNDSGQASQKDITKVVAVPPAVHDLLRTACYDCHSNSTVYPWYAWMQPGGWFMDSHVRNGKKELNFSDFGSYSTRRQASKMKAIANMVTEGRMPLSSYTLLHKAARLTGEQKQMLIRWSRGIADTLEQQKN